MRHTPPYVFVISLGLLSFNGNAQTPTHQYVHNNTVGTAASTVYGVAHDSQGNLIACGGRLDALDFGSNAYAAGTGGIFVAKFGSDGSEYWTKVAGSSDTNGNHKAMSVAVDGNDNVYVAGWLFTPLASTFDGVTVPAGSAGFVAKYNPGGTLLWVKGYGANVNAIAVDGNGNPFINLGDATIEKLDPANGNSVASASGGGDLMNVVYHNAAVDAANNVYAQWGNKITKYDNALNVLWSTPLTKPLGAESFRITVDDNGDVWATFYALFGTVSLGGTDYSTFPNGYIYKLSGADGSVLSCASPGAFKIKEVFHFGGGELEVFGDFAFNQPNLVKYDAALTSLWSVPTYDTKDAEPIGPGCYVSGGQHSADITLDGSTFTRPNGSGQENAIAGYLCEGGVGITEAQLHGGLLLFPNPASSATTMHVRTRDIGSYYRVNDLAGTEVLRGRITSTRMDLDLSNLAGGCYLLRVEGVGLAPVRLVKD